MPEATCLIRNNKPVWRFTLTSCLRTRNIPLFSSAEGSPNPATTSTNEAGNSVTMIEAPTASRQKPGNCDAAVKVSGGTKLTRVPGIVSCDGKAKTAEPPANGRTTSNKNQILIYSDYS